MAKALHHQLWEETIQRFCFHPLVVLNELDEDVAVVGERRQGKGTRSHSAENVEKHWYALEFGVKLILANLFGEN